MISSSWNYVWHVELLNEQMETEEEWTKETNIVLRNDVKYSLHCDLRLTKYWTIRKKNLFFIYSDEAPIPAEDRQKMQLNGSNLGVKCKCRPYVVSGGEGGKSPGGEADSTPTYCRYMEMKAQFC